MLSKVRNFFSQNLFLEKQERATQYIIDSARNASYSEIREPLLENES
jgi:hypothetical protein